MSLRNCASEYGFLASLFPAVLSAILPNDEQARRLAFRNSLTTAPTSFFVPASASRACAPMPSASAVSWATVRCTTRQALEAEVALPVFAVYFMVLPELAKVR